MIKLDKIRRMRKISMQRADADFCGFLSNIDFYRKTPEAPSLGVGFMTRLQHRRHIHSLCIQIPSARSAQARIQSKRLR